MVGDVGFSVAHDAIHRAISTNTRLNDWIGQLGVMLLIPFVDLRLFRWGHVLHHRFVSGARDPDTALRGAWWTLPLRWMFIGVVYLIHTLRHGDRISTPFYNNHKVWKLIEREMRGHDLAVQRGFAIDPKIRPAQENA